MVDSELEAEQEMLDERKDDLKQLAQLTKTYANYLQHQDQHNLNVACAPFCMMGFGTYLVGSCLERADFRDVDVRCILPDEQFAALPCIDTLNACVSEWLRQRTGLPIDFQFQAQTDANAKYPGKRHGLGHPVNRPDGSCCCTWFGGEQVTNPACTIHNYVRP